MEFILRVNVVSDNILKVAPKGKIFKGGFVAIVKENTFQNACQDKETIKKFRTEESLMKYLNKNYDKEVVFEIDLTDTCFDC